MVYVPAPNTLMVEIRGTLSGEEVENTLYFARGDTIEEAEVEALFDWLETVFLPDYLTGKASLLLVDELYGTDLTTSTSPTYSRVFSPPLPGDQVLEPEPGSIAMCVSFRTNARGRSARGRNYIPGFVSASITNNFFGLATIDANVATYELLLGGGTFPAGWDWVMISRFFEGVARVVALIRVIIDVLSTDVTVDSQRGRLR